MATTLSFLFWNIRRAQGTRFYESLGRLTQRGIDVFLFAELPDDNARLLDALNGGPEGLLLACQAKMGDSCCFHA